MKTQLTALCLLVVANLSYASIHSDQEARDEDSLQIRDDDAIELRDEDALQLDERAQDPFLLQDLIQSVTSLRDKAQGIIDFGKKAVEVSKKVFTAGEKVYDAGKRAIEIIESLGAKAHKALNAIGISDETLKAMPHEILQQGQKAIEAFAKARGDIK